MASPEVWTDARARIEAVAATLGLSVAWPNEPTTTPEPPAMFAAVEISGDMSEPIELGPSGIWEESGSVWVHVLSPAGTGITDALAARKAFANAFRGVSAGGVTYRGASMDPGGMDDDGAWYRSSLSVHYVYQDR